MEIDTSPIVILSSFGILNNNSGIQKFRDLRADLVFNSLIPKSLNSQSLNLSPSRPFTKAGPEQLTIGGCARPKGSYGFAKAQDSTLSV
jgi:hypothetical protein